MPEPQMSETFNDKHLLWWLLKVIAESGQSGITSDDILHKDQWAFLGAPDWVLPALHEKLEAMGSK